MVWARSCSVAQLCPALCSPTGSSVHGMFGQENGAGLPFPLWGSSRPRPGPHPLHWQGFFTASATWEARGLGGVGLAGHRDYTWRTRMKEGWGQRPHSTLGPRPDEWEEAGLSDRKALAARAPRPATLRLTHSRLNDSLSANRRTAPPPLPAPALRTPAGTIPLTSVGFSPSSLS